MKHIHNYAFICLAASTLILFSCISEPTLLTVAQPFSVLATPGWREPPQMQAPATDPMFDTPEEAIRHYLEGVAQNDIGMILEATAAYEVSDGYDFALEIERLGGAISFVPFLAPGEHQFYSEMNWFQISAQILQQVKLLTYRLLAGDIVGDGATMVQVSPELVDQLIHDLNPERLSGLEVIQVGSPLKTSDAMYKEIAARKARVYGAEEFTERVSLVEFEENYYTVGFSLLRFGESWKIMSQSSPLAEIGPSGIPEETTVDSFAGMILSD